MISREERNILRGFAERIAPDDPGAHNNLAIVYYNKGLYDESIEELEKALEIDPTFVLARNNLDIVLKATGRLEEQVEQLSRSIEHEPYDEEKTLHLADKYRKLNRYSQAIRCYKRVIDANSQSVDAFFGLGITLKLLGKYDDALEEVKRALEIQQSVRIYRTLGELYFNKGVIDLAIKNFQEAISLDNGQAETHFLLGFALGEKGKLEDSLQEVRKAIELNPALAQFEPNLPIDIERHKTHWEFLKEQLGVPASEKEYGVHFRLGTAYRNKGLFSEAKREFTECLAYSENKPELHLALAEIALLLNQVDEAQNHLDHISEQDISALYANARGVVCILKDDFENSRMWLIKALELQHDFDAAFNNLGVCAHAQGETDDALQWYQKAVAAGNTDACYNMGMYYLRKHDFESASTLFGGDSPDDYFGRAIIHAELGEDEKAIELLNRVVELMPHHAGAYYNLGFIYTKLGRFKEGLEYTRRGIELEPAYEDSKLRLCLGPEVVGFGPYYRKRGEGVTVTEEETAKAAEVSEENETALPELDLPSAAQYVEQAEEHLKQEDYESALAAIDQARAIDPDAEQTIMLKAQILERTANVSDAINLLKKYLNRHHGSQRVQAELAHLLESAGRLEEAQQMYSSLLETDSAHAEWLAHIADIFYRLGQFDDALTYYNRLYERDNGNLAANLGFLRICIKNRNISKATTYIRFLKEKYPDNYEFNFLAGLYHMDKGEREDAIAYFKKAIEIDSSKPSPYYHYGLLQIQKGDFEGACSNWKKALLLSPDEELVKKIRHCLRITVELSEFIKSEASP